MESTISVAENFAPDFHGEGVGQVHPSARSEGMPAPSIHQGRMYAVELRLFALLDHIVANEKVRAKTRIYKKNEGQSIAVRTLWLFVAHVLAAVSIFRQFTHWQ